MIIKDIITKKVVFKNQLNSPIPRIGEKIVYNNSILRVLDVEYHYTQLEIEIIIYIEFYQER